MRTRTGAAALAAGALAAVLGAVVTATPSQAIDADRGWTHLYNNNYPAGSTNVECQADRGGQGCIGWDARDWSRQYQVVRVENALTGTFFDNEINRSLNGFVNPLVPTGVATAHSPYYQRTGGDGRVVRTTAADIGTLCGSASMTTEARAPRNYGAFQTRTIVGATVRLNTRRSYSNTGTINSTTCEVRWTLNHEYGHTLGLGHTRSSTQTMFTNNVAVYSSQTGDEHGVQCIYEVVNCQAAL